MLLHLGYSPGPANFRTHDSSPDTLTLVGNKSRVSGVGVELNRPETRTGCAGGNWLVKESADARGEQEPHRLPIANYQGPRNLPA